MVVPYFQPAWAYGGIPRLAYGLSRALQLRGNELRVVTTDALDAHSRTSAGVEQHHGIEIHRLSNLSNQLAYQHQLFLPRGAADALEAAVSQADVVHLHGWWHLLNNYALSAAARHQVPIVVTPNGTLLPLERKLAVKSLWHRFLGAPVQQAASRWIAVSRAEVNQFARAGIAADRIHLIYNGLDLGEFEELPERGSFRRQEGLGDAPMLLYLGKLTPRKGVDHLIEALSRLQNPDARLIVAGNDMGVRAGLEQRVRSLELGERVRFVGLVTGERRRSALADADVLVYPSSDEIFGLVPFEGLLAGTPAVVSDDCGCGELVAQARAGELVRFGDSTALARSLDRLLADAERRRRMVSRGRAFIQRHFAWPRIALQTESVYRVAIAD